MTLLIFHLVLSSFTFEGVDIQMAQKILDYHIQRYPNGASSATSSLSDPGSADVRNTHSYLRCSHQLSSFFSFSHWHEVRLRADALDTGVFFLFGQGRLHLCRSQPSTALVYYQKALQAQNQYRNLHHISFWEMAIANLALWDVAASLDHWRTLAAEASVSSLRILAILTYPLCPRY